MNTDVFDFSQIVPSIPYILKGIGVTLQIVIFATIIGLVLGILLALCKIGKIAVLRWFADVLYVYFPWNATCFTTNDYLLCHSSTF